MEQPNYRSRAFGPMAHGLAGAQGHRYWPHLQDFGRIRFPVPDERDNELAVEQKPNAGLAPGVWGVLATPFRHSTLDVDEVSLAREVEHYVSLEATGLVALGVFGEAARLDTSERRRVVERVRSSSGGLPIVVGSTARATAPAIEDVVLAQEAAGDALRAVMLQVSTSSAEGLAEHLTTVHEATGTDIVLQDYPLVSGVAVSAVTLARVVGACPFVVAVKSEAPPTAPAVSHLTEHTPVPVFGGLGGVGLLDELLAGAAGAMTGFSHPEALQATVSAYGEEGFVAAREALAPWLPLANFEGQARIGLAIRKEVLRRRGLIEDSVVRPPGQQLPASMVALIDQHLAAVSTLVP